VTVVIAGDRPIAAGTARPRQRNEETSMTDGQTLAAAPLTSQTFAAPHQDDATLLLVDDEPSILSALRRLFRPEGYRVLVAEGGAQALDLIKDERVDLVISDMRMPGMDGAQFLEKLRETQPDTVRILLTGYADISSTIAAINAGQIHRYIAKPWNDHDIVLIVREALQRRALEQRNRQLSELSLRQNEELRELNASLEDRVRQRTAEIGQINDMLNVAYEELKSNFMLSMRIFSGLMELRHKGLSGHSSRVSEWARRVCDRLKLDERRSHDIYVAALLHDIGKIGFPDGLLSKPISTMTPDEVARYRKHPLNAEAALMPLAQLQGVSKFIRSQHERIDGNGFPDRLEGDAIPFGARVLAPIIDYENLLAGTLAERRFTPDEAAASIRRGAGSRYDPTVVDAFLHVQAAPLPANAADRCISARELVAGMVLSRDLTSAQGTLLLAAGYVFDARVVNQVREFAQREGAKLLLHVCGDSIGTGAAGSPPAA
jgi:response regulator RpfG family c-di-GMP phosphodiesterase